MKKTKILLLLAGIFLVLDGLLSIILGNECLNSCLNNSTIGNIVRIVRLLIGIILIVFSFEK